jgi:F5/8 type C domain
MGTSSLFKVWRAMLVMPLAGMLAQACSSEPFTGGGAGGSGAGEGATPGDSGQPEGAGAGGAEGETLPRASHGGASTSGTGGEVASAGMAVGGESSVPMPMPCDRSTWSVTAWSDSNPAAPVADMVDGDLMQGWGPEEEQQPGQWIEVDLGRVMTLRGLALLTPVEATAPQSLEVRFDPMPRAVEGMLVSLGGGVTATFDFSGSTLRVTFTPTPVRVVRLTISSALASRWRIYELTGECQ